MSKCWCHVWICVCATEQFISGQTRAAAPDYFVLWPTTRNRWPFIDGHYANRDVQTNWWPRSHVTVWHFAKVMMTGRASRQSIVGQRGSAPTCGRQRLRKQHVRATLNCLADVVNARCLLWDRVMFKEQLEDRFITLKSS